MPIGGKLTVASANEYKNFTVRFDRNTTITNFTGRNMGNEGDIRTVVKNGSSGVTEKMYSKGKHSGELSTLDLNTKRYQIFDEMRKLDGNANDVSETDFAKAKSLIGKYGITNVKRDASSGITTIYCNDGAVLKFDTETDKEMAVRKKQETYKATLKKQAQAEAQKKKEQEAAELHENCKSTLEKVAEWIYSFFD